ncbi:MAG: hypothetical protein ACE5EY_17670, partial [Anaerolineae bacterium]
VQQVAQINGHSWAEVYFAGIGWVEFEPTAAFASPHETRASVSGAEAVAEEDPIPQTPLPLPRGNQRGSSGAWGWWLAGGTAVLFIVWRLRLRQKPGREEGVVWAYGRMQAIAPRLGHDVEPSQTPAEFSQGLASVVRPFSRQNSRLAGWFSPLPETIERLSQLYTRRQYSPQKSGNEEEAMRHWQQLRLPLQFLRIVTIIQGKKHKRETG